MHHCAAAYRQDTLSSTFDDGRTAAPGWKPGTGGFMYAIASSLEGFLQLHFTASTTSVASTTKL